MFTFSKSQKLFFIMLSSLVWIACSKSKIKPVVQEPDPSELPKLPQQEAKALPSKIELTNNNETVTYTFNYVSATHKLDQIVQSNFKTETYHYEGDLIVKKTYNNASDNNYKTYIYDNSILQMEIENRNGQAINKSTYEYLPNSKVKISEYRFINNNWKEEGEAINLTFDTKGNIVSGKGTPEDGVELQITGTYDQKYSPLYNITGWAKINILSGIPFGDNIDIVDAFGRSNNPISIRASSTNGLMNITFNFTYEFNDVNNSKFPTKVICKEGTNTVFSAKITY